MPVQSTVEILQNFVAFSEYVNFSFNLIFWLKVMLISFHFLFFVLVKEVTKIQKYIVIFCLSCKARHARKNKQTEHIVKKIMQLKWPKYEKTKIPKWNEPNIKTAITVDLSEKENVLQLVNTGPQKCTLVVRYFYAMSFLLLRVATALSF